MIKNIIDLSTKRGAYDLLLKVIAFEVVVVFLILLYGESFSGLGHEAAEKYMEAINVVLVSAILLIGVTVYFKIGGVLRSTIIYLNIVLVFFWLMEFLQVISEFDLLYVSGAVVDFFELCMIVSLFVAINKLRKVLI